MNLFAAFLSPERHYRVDRLNPWVVHFTGNFGIRWYGIAYLAGILFAYIVSMRWAKQGGYPFLLRRCQLSSYTPP